MVLNSEKAGFFDCIIMDKPCSVIFADDFAKFIASIKSFSDIDG